MAVGGATRTAPRRSWLGGEGSGGVCPAPQLTSASLHRWLLPPQALNAYYLPNKNQMGKGRVLKGAGLGVGQVSC